MNDIGTDHALIRDDLEAFLDGELDDSRARAVRGHLVGCERCRHELRTLEGLGRLLLANRPQIAPSADFERSFAAAFRLEARGRREFQRPSPQPNRGTEPAPRSDGAFAWLLRPVLVPLAVATAAAAATILLRPDEAVDVAAPLDPAPIESVAASVPAETTGIELVAEVEPAAEPAPAAEPPPVIAEGKEPSGSAPALAVAAEEDLLESASVEAAAP